MKSFIYTLNLKDVVVPYREINSNIYNFIVSEIVGNQG
jgi:hypothetical protein